MNDFFPFLSFSFFLLFETGLFVLVVGFATANRFSVTGEVLSEKLGRGVRPTSQNPYPIYDQNLRFSLPVS